jgi:hypothetical protein
MKYQSIPNVGFEMAATTIMTAYGLAPYVSEFGARTWHILGGRCGVTKFEI